MRPSRLTITAAALLALEALALLVITLIEVLGLSSGAATSLPTALALIALSAVGAVGLAGLAYAVLRGHSFGRSGGMVVQIVGVAIALSSVPVRPFPAVFVFSLLIPGVIGVVMLFVLSRRASAEDRRRVGTDGP